MGTKRLLARLGPVDARYGLEAYASAPLRYTSPQVKVLHCLTVKGQEAQRKGVVARRGLRHLSAR